MVGKQSLRYAAIAVVMAVICGSVAVAYWLTQPPQIRLGLVGGPSIESQVLLAFEEKVRRDKAPFVVVVSTYASVTELRDAFSRGAIDVAPFATREPVPDDAETVVILRRTRLFLVALDRETAASKSVADRIALVSSDAEAERIGSAILAAAFELDGREPVRTSAADAARALQAGRVDLVAIAAPDGANLLRDIVGALPPASQAKATVRPAPKTEHIARRNAAIESVPLKAGALSSNPPLPADEVDTLSMTTRLMARHDFSETTVTELTRTLLAMQRQLAQVSATAAQIEPPPAERGAALPTHAGAIAFVEGEELTTFERYGDWIYLAAFGASGLGSVWAGFFSWRESARRRIDLRRLAALQRIIAETAEARSSAEIAAMTQRYRTLLNEVILAAAHLRIDQTDLIAFTMASSLFRETRRERIDAMTGRDDAREPWNGGASGRLEPASRPERPTAPASD